ncbi:protein kinase [Nonomuraea sp. NPDC050556]|uniref:serine/threonine-protein kinase n=1 Tax=Nonomuraea sp. NPDC050556 TaxID=3364369 RepID=UPI0037B42E8A
MNQPRLVGGRYQLLEPLGQGGMGIVWRAHDTAIGREVAIKEVRQAGPRERILHEARNAAAIRHPAAVAVHDVVDDFGEPWIVMELIKGRSLDQLIKTGGPVSPEWAASIGLFVLSALATAHARGMLHRDVKPGNVLLADDGRILLSDFGIATQAGAATSGGTAGPMGTPGFTAPESLTEEHLAGPASDLWSLGATLYAAVEGVPPFQRPTAMAMHGAVMTEPPRPPQRAGALGPLLMALLSKNPAQRPDLASTRKALQQITGSTAPTQRSAPTAWVVSKPLAYGSAAAALVAFVAAVTLILTTSSAPAQQPVAAKPTPTKQQQQPSKKPEPSAEPSAQPSTYETGKITAMPRPCQLLTRQQATQIFGRYLTTAGDRGDECIWSYADITAPDSRQIALFSHFWLYPQQGDGYETKLAQEHMAGAKAAAGEKAGRGGSGEKQGEVFDIPGAGDEAFGYELAKTKFGGKREFEVHVSFRAGNMVGEFRLNRRVASDARLRDKAAEAAKLMAAAINSKAS